MFPEATGLRFRVEGQRGSVEDYTFQIPPANVFSGDSTASWSSGLSGRVVSKP